MSGPEREAICKEHKSLVKNNTEHTFADESCKYFPPWTGTLSGQCQRALWLLLCRHPRTTPQNRKLDSAQGLRSTHSSSLPPVATFPTGADHCIPDVIPSASSTSSPRPVPLTARVHLVPPRSATELHPTGCLLSDPSRCPGRNRPCYSHCHL